MAANDEYLFSELTGSNKYENRSMAIGKRFGRLKEKLGFGRNYGFHSFRSTLANLFDAAGVRESFAARIIGHKTRNNGPKCSIPKTYSGHKKSIQWQR